MYICTSLSTILKHDVVFYFLGGPRLRYVDICLTILDFYES